MSYRKVGTIEQCYYIISGALRIKFRKLKKKRKKGDANAAREQ